MALIFRSKPTLKIGFIYQVEVKLKNRKNKHALCLALDPFEYFYFNSAAYSCQDAVEVKNIPHWQYPHHDCFLDVALIHTSGKVIKELGCLHASHMQPIIEAIQNSKILTGAQKTKLLYALKQYKNILKK